MKISWLYIPLVCCAVVTTLQSCWQDERPQFPLGVVDAYVPVYSSPSLKEISFEAPRAVQNPGKIYIYNSYLLINEPNEGIHVFDNSDPTKPLPLGFLQLLGSQEIAIRDNVLYANHLGDIVALKITDFQTLTLQGRVTVSEWGMGVPPPAGSYFECADPSRGMVMSWAKRKIENPKCYADYF
jgi:hypothetical protein